MIQIYTGSGKGKTTAAVGLAFRALGHGKRVLLIQFIKSGRDNGEVKAGQRFSKFKVLHAGQNGWIKKNLITVKDKQLAQRGLNFAHQAIESEKYDLVILDELNVALNYNLLKLQEVKQVLKGKPKNVEVVITGRDAHPEILKIANLVSEIRKVKHYYKKGVPARAGIEY